mmetsp:Transcript_123062/g.359266  ORF Transcript_123062/g.359266 Transcript_123062/m.359266 type:complete len:237 (-) Transcript_123062:290-1000(-)
MSSAREPSAAWWPATSWSLLVSRSLASMPRLFTRSCWMFTPVAVSPGSEAVAMTLATPAAASRSFSARVKSTLQALERQYWSHALNLLASVPLRSSTFSSLAWYRAPLDCEAMRPLGLLLSRGSSSEARRKWPSALTCMTASFPSPVASRRSSRPPPRPALRQRRSSEGSASRMATPNCLTESRLLKSSVALGTVTSTPGPAARRAASAAACASPSMPGRAGTKTLKPRRARPFTT